MTARKLIDALNKSPETQHLSVTLRKPDDLDGIEGLGSLRHLTVNCKLKELPPIVGELVELLSLEVTGRTLEVVPTWLDRLRSLITLNLGGNRLEQIPGKIGHLVALERLRLNSNRLLSLPSEIGALSGLKSLVLDNNSLESLPNELVNLAELEELSVVSNKLKCLPEGFSQLSRLRSLQSDKNTGIDVRNLAGLKGLVNLGLRNCRLRSLPESIGELQSLLGLSLGMNPFGIVPTPILKLKNLRNLYLWGCGLKKVPKELGELRHLEVLELEKNDLEGLPDSLKQLDSLRVLYLEKNCFAEFPAAVLEMTGLQDLNLSDNRIEEIPSAINRLDKLSRLRLEGHALQRFPSDLSGLRELKHLSLQGTKQTAVSMREAVKKLPPQAFIMMWTKGDRARDMARDGRWCDAPIELTEEATKAQDWIFNHTNRVRGVAFSPDSKRLVSCGYDGLRAWDLINGEPLWFRRGTYFCLAISPDGTKILAGGETSRAELHDAATGETVGQLGRLNHYTKSVAFSPDGSLALALSGKGQLNVYELSTGACLYALQHETEGSTAAFSTDGTYLISGGQRAVLVWSCETGALLGRLVADRYAVHAVGLIDLTKTAMTGGLDKALKFWDLTRWVEPKGHRKTSSKRKPPVETLDSEAVKAFFLSNDGSLALTAGGDSVVYLWDVSERKMLSSFAGHNQGVDAVALSLDGQLGASGGCDKTVRVWPLNAAPPK